MSLKQRCRDAGIDAAKTAWEYEPMTTEAKGRRAADAALKECIEFVRSDQVWEAIDAIIDKAWKSLEAPPTTDAIIAGLQAEMTREP